MSRFSGGQVIVMEPEYIYGTVPKPPEIIKVPEAPWPWIAGAVLLVGGLATAFFSKRRRR